MNGICGIDSQDDKILSQVGIQIPQQVAAEIQTPGKTPRRGIIISVGQRPTFSIRDVCKQRSMNYKKNRIFAN